MDNNANLVPSLYSEHIKDEPLDRLNQTNKDVVSSWFNTLTAGHFYVSGSSLMSTPNPQQRLWSSPKQFASSGMLHIPNADQMSKQLIQVTNPPVHKHRCPHPQCSFTTDKSFNLQRHVNKKHTGHPRMPWIGVGTATNAATTTSPVVTTTNPVVTADTKTPLKTIATAHASDFEVVSSPSTMLASSLSTLLASSPSVALFKCVHCQFTSKKKFNVKRHIRQQHDRQVVTCDGCNRRCRNQYYLNLYHKPKCPYPQLNKTV